MVANEKKSLVVLIAFCGSRATGPNINRLIKNIRGYKTCTIGIDANENVPGRFLVDDFLVCPKDRSEFVDFVKDICSEKGVDIVLCTSTENSLIPLKKEQKWFDDRGIKLPGCKLDILEIAGNKSKMLQSLKSSGLPCADFYIPHSIQEFELYATLLGYPKKKIVVKPPIASGNRGFTILDSEYRDSYSGSILGKRSNLAAILTKKQFVSLLAGEDSFPDVVMMEYLPGQDYSVYCYAVAGKALAVIPVKRLNPGPGVSYTSQVDLNEKIIQFAKHVVEHFELDWNINIQMRISNTGQPLVYEINPRIAGSIILTSAAGCNLLEIGVLHAMGDIATIDQPKNGVIMHRYLTEVYH